MSEKKYFAGLNIVKDKFNNNEATPVENNPNVILSEADVYQTNYDYLNINNDKDKELLFQYEFIINNSISQINKNLKNICEKLFLAQKLLANYDNTQGYFVRWFTSFGIDKNFVYRCVDRYKVYLETKKDIYLTEKVSIRGIQLIKNVADIETKVEIAERFERSELVNSKQLQDFLLVKYNTVTEKISNEKIVTAKYSIEQKTNYLNIRLTGNFNINDMKRISEMLDGL